MPTSSSLVEQLCRNSTPYRDPVARIDWDRLDEARHWLPPEALSLHGVPDFNALPDPAHRRLSQYEFLHFLEAWLWVESVLMERLARALAHAAHGRAEHRYRLHELREEAGHSLMFLELIERSGLNPPYRKFPRFWLVDWFGRHAPFDSTAFWMAVTIGEEIPDRLNRYVRRYGDALCPVVVQLCTAHTIDEARHITYAHEQLDTRLADVRGWQRCLLALLMRRLLREFVDVFYYPPAAVYEVAGLSPGGRWTAAARANPRRREFIRRCIKPTLDLFRRRGIPLEREPRC